MSSGSNKLVDKYQYNDSQIKSDGFAEIITAKHIVLRELFTLKKISTTNSKAAAKYYGIVNEMNIIKTLGDQPFLFKCHKMLKTSNNLYLVYDFMGNYSTLAQLIENSSLNDQNKKKYIALQILNFLKKLKKYKIIFLDLSAQNIQVDDNLQVKFVSLENAIFLNKNIASLAFLNLKISENLAPELKQLIEQCSIPYEKQIQYETFQDKIDKADLFSFGKILQKMFFQKFYFTENQSQRNINNEESFQLSMESIVQRLTSADPNQRPSYEQIEALLSDDMTSTKREIQVQNPQIRISRQERNTLNIGSVNSLLKKSRSSIKIPNNNSADKTQNLLIPSNDDSFDKKSVRSSGQYTDSTSNAKIKLKKSSFANQVLSQNSTEEDFKGFVLKILTRRNLYKLLLNLSKLIFEMTLIDLNERTMLSFLLLKKGVLLICSLARFVSTGKGDGEQLTVKELIRRQFAKTNDFFILSVLIDKQMDNAKAIYQTTVGKLRTEFSELKNIKQYNFEYECISQNLNEKVLKQLVRKSLIQIVKKLQTPVKQMTEPAKRSPRMFLNPSDHFLSSTVRSHARNNSDFDDIASVRSAKSIRTTVQGNSMSQVTLQNFHSEKVLRNISFDHLILIYLMGLILDFESYEKMFVKLIQDSNVRFQDQSLLKELRKMEPREIAFKLAQVVK